MMMMMKVTNIYKHEIVDTGALLQFKFVITWNILVEIGVHISWPCMKLWTYVRTCMLFKGWQIKNAKEMSLYKNGLISFVLFEQPVLSKNIDSLWKMNLL